MAKFYALYSSEKFLQAVGKSENENLPQVVGKLKNEIFSVPFFSKDKEK